MPARRSLIVKKTALAMIVAVLGGLALAQPPAAPAPGVTITLKDRHGQATPCKRGFTHTGGGNIDVAQPTPDTVIVTMTGVAVAGAHPYKDSSATMTFDLDQCLEITCADPKVKRAKVTLEGRVIGLLRSHKGGGSAEQGPAHAGLSNGAVEFVPLDLPSHCVRGGDNRSINDRCGPASAIVVPAEYHLHQSFAVSASHPHSLKMCKAASSEFAADPALDPLWISYWEPFHGAGKKDFDFQVTLKVSAE
jgi:hypothetical protein